ncbi:MAG: hypothetical protein ACP5C3_00575 [Methanomicrobiales archaeon]
MADNNSYVMDLKREDIHRDDMGGRHLNCAEYQKEDLKFPMQPFYLDAYSDSIIFFR